MRLNAKQIAGCGARPVRCSGCRGWPRWIRKRRTRRAVELYEREAVACDEVVWAEDVALDAEGRPCFTLCARDRADEGDLSLFAPVERCRCALALTGAHNVDNAVAAAAPRRPASMRMPRAGLPRLRKARPVPAGRAANNSALARAMFSRLPSRRLWALPCPSRGARRSSPPGAASPS